MTAVNPRLICNQARAYYYDYLCGEPRECVPGEMLTHLDKCRSCQAEVNRLRLILAEAEENARESTTRAATTASANLRLHLAYTGILITCSSVKPFLPSLAIPALEIGVPTPITVHLDKCQQCASDLEVIRRLNLTQKQLCRLGQIFAYAPTESAVDCSQARADTFAVVQTAFHETDAEVLKHLSTCPGCRERLYQYREAFRAQLLDSGRLQGEFCSEEVSATDVFNYCFPYGIDPANDQCTKFLPTLTLHLRECPKCLGKMQQLHRTLSNVAERPDSEVVTCFTFEEQADEGFEPGRDDLYSAWPIKVAVSDKPGKTASAEPKSPEAAAGAQVPLKPGRRYSILDVRPFIKTAALAAAIVLIVLLLLNVPVAKAVYLGQIYNALERLKNICLTTFDLEKPEPTQQIWISEALDIMILKTKEKCVLWDIYNKSSKSKELITGSSELTTLNSEALAKVAKAMQAPWGLLPFDDMSQVPPDATWQQVAAENIKTTIPHTRVYDLMWTEKTLAGFVAHNRWRGYIDIDTKLPRRVEQWEKRSGEEYELTTVIKVTYPTAAEIQAVVNDAGF